MEVSFIPNISDEQCYANSIESTIPIGIQQSRIKIINVEKESGSINVINKLGNNEISLIKENGEYEDTVYIDGMSYYLIVKLENFNGKINIISE